MLSFLEIDPKTLDEVHDFELAVRMIAEGNYHGKRLSRKIGEGMEFSQYRPYSQGDDLRQLDWKMYARSGKFYIKQSEIETDIELTFIIDNSKSMLYEEEGISKLQAAKLITAVFAYISNNTGDRFSLAGKPGLASGDGVRHWQRMLHFLQALDTTDTFEKPSFLNKRSKELIVVCSDLYDENFELLKFISSLSTPKNEVVVFHFLGSVEKSLDLMGAYTFEDLETGKKIDVMPSSSKVDYSQRIDSWTNENKKYLLEKGIDYFEVNFTTPIQDIIRKFINKRKELL